MYCDYFAHRYRDPVSYLIVSNPAQTSIANHGFCSINLHNQPSWKGEGTRCVGDCDNVWGNRSGILYAMLGGRCGHTVACGTSFMHFDDAGYTRRLIGACDYYWTNLSGVRRAFYGGRCDDWTDCGTSCFAWDSGSDDMRWYLGACDFGWGNLSGLRYALYGGRCGYEMDCGLYFLDLCNESDYAVWTVGA